MAMIAAVQPSESVKGIPVYLFSQVGQVVGSINDPVCSPCDCLLQGSLLDCARGDAQRALLLAALRMASLDGSSVVRLRCQCGIPHRINLWLRPGFPGDPLLCGVIQTSDASIGRFIEASPEPAHLILDPHGRVVDILDAAACLSLPQRVLDGDELVWRACAWIEGVADLPAALMDMHPSGSLAIRVVLSDPPGLAVDARINVIEIGAGARMHALTLTKQSLLTVEGLLDELAEVRQHNRALTLGLRRLGHDLRTPLNALMGYCQLVESRIRAGLQIPTDMLPIAGVASTQVKSILNQLIEVSERAQQPSGPLGDVNVGEVMTHAVALMPTLMARLSMHEPVRELRAIGQQSWVLEALLNLLSNADKHSVPGTLIGFSAHDDSDRQEVHFLVSNTSTCFLGDADLDKAMSGMRCPTTDAPGHGLGLANSAILARMMNGRLNHETSPLEGGHFEVRARLSIPKSSVGAAL